jgi:hypothetical protein
MEYEIAESNSLIEMVEDVNNMINEGWEPFGGIAVSSCETWGYKEKTYIQAMIKVLK